MAGIDDLVAEVSDPRLREQLRSELALLKRQRTFGLVFPTHIPEMVPIYSATIRVGSRVAQRTGSIAETFRVTSVRDGEAVCQPETGTPKALKFKTDHLTVVKRFGEAIFPAIKPINITQPHPGAANHILIEADNYHALQLLEWLYADRVDCIYIDPPYNTGAKDWKYNNNYVDTNDAFRSSKWLAMMNRRLAIAFRLLKSTGVMCITIDDYEAHHLRCLLEQYFPGSPVLGVVAIRNNPSGRATVSGLSVCHEYAVLVGKSSEAELVRIPRSVKQWARFKECDEEGRFEWRNFRKDGGAVTYRTARPKQYYPIYVRGDAIRIPKMTWSSKDRNWIIEEHAAEDEFELWPIDDNGNDRVWSLSPKSTINEIAQLIVRYDNTGVPSIYRKYRPNEAGVLPRSWWDKSIYAAREYGSAELKNIFGEANIFPFSKSRFATKDCLWICGGSDPDALIVDFFAGSGTTLEAVAELNGADGGRRRCVLVTNNEVWPEESAQQLVADGHLPGTDEYERHGICQAVTYPRCESILSGKRIDGSPLEGASFTGNLAEKIVKRKIRLLSFLGAAWAEHPRSREDLALALGLTKGALCGQIPWYISAADGCRDRTKDQAVLLERAKFDEFQVALHEHGQHVRTISLASHDLRWFNTAKKVLSQLPPIFEEAPEVRALSAGFAQNLNYFRLDFLDPDSVELGASLSDIVPLIWMMSGAEGRVPSLRKGEDYIISDNERFAVLVHDPAFRKFLDEVDKNPQLEWIFIISDSRDSFAEMNEQLPSFIPARQRVHLYRNYIDNFQINVARGVQ